MICLALAKWPLLPQRPERSMEATRTLSLSQGPSSIFMLLIPNLPKRPASQQSQRQGEVSGAWGGLSQPWAGRQPWGIGACEQRDSSSSDLTSSIPSSGWARQDGLGASPEPSCVATAASAPGRCGGSAVLLSQRRLKVIEPNLFLIKEIISRWVFFWNCT